MVGVVVVDLCLEFFQHVAEVRLLETQAEAFALELRAIHTASSVTRLTVTLASGQLQQCVGARGPAHGHIAVPLVVARRHGVVVAVAVIVGMGGVADHSHIALRATGGGIHHFVEAPVGATQHAGVHPAAELAEAFWLAVKQDGASRSAGAPEHGLRALDDRQLVVGLWRDVRGRCVHSTWAGTQQCAAVGEDVQPRAEHAAQHRVAIGAAVAHQGEAGDGLEVVAAVTGRHRLARVLGVGDDGQGRAGGDGGDDRRAQFFDLLVVMLVLIGEYEWGEQQAAQGGDGLA
ncbi:hypothetical protein D3C78_944990 [compost metagenome]